MLYKLEDYWIKELNRADDNVGKTERVVIGDDTYIEVEELLGIIEQFNYQLESVQDELTDLERDLHDNYRPIPPEEQYEGRDY